jgi:hypothetical protein
MSPADTPVTAVQSVANHDEWLLRIPVVHESLPAGHPQPSGGLVTASEDQLRTLIPRERQRGNEAFELLPPGLQHAVVRIVSSRSVPASARVLPGRGAPSHSSVRRRRKVGRGS